MLNGSMPGWSKSDNPVPECVSQILAKKENDLAQCKILSTALDFTKISQSLKSLKLQREESKTDDELLRGHLFSTILTFLIDCGGKFLTITFLRPCIITLYLEKRPLLCLS